MWAFWEVGGRVDHRRPATPAATRTKSRSSTISTLRTIRHILAPGWCLSVPIGDQAGYRRRQID